MTTRAQTAATLHSEITANTYAAPPTAAHRAILAALVAEGVLNTNGTYKSGKGQADVLRAITVASITEECLERAIGVRGI